MKTRYIVEVEKFYSSKGDEFKFVIEKGRRPSWLKEKFQRSLPAEAYEFILNFLPEFEKIWKAVKTLGSVSSTSTEQQRQAALTCFDAHPDWKYLNRKSLKARYPWQWRGGHEKGDFRGRLLQELFDDRFPELPQYGAKTFDDVARKIIRDFETDKK